LGIEGQGYLQDVNKIVNRIVRSGLIFLAQIAGYSYFADAGIDALSLPALLDGGITANTLFRFTG